MKKYIGIFILATSLLVQSCKKEDKNVFDESPNARVTAALAGYQKILTDATTGWKGVLYPAGDSTKAFTFYFKFTNTNRVTMLSDFTDSFASVPRESSYRLKALQTPALIFDTYSYLHVLSDPDPTSSGNGGSVGQGLSSDFEFALDSSTTRPDSITMIGRQHNSIMKMTKLTASEATVVAASGLMGGRIFANINKYLNYFKRITLNGTSYEINANTVTRTITFSWLDASGNLVSITVPFIYGVDGISFAHPVTLGTLVITGFTNMTWDAVNISLSFKVNGTATTVIGLGQPLKIDLGAPYRWWKYSADQSDYWISAKGFHVNGVDDFFGVTALPGWSYMLFWSKYNLSGTTYYDAFAGVINNAITGQATYSPDPPPATSTTKTVFTADGRIIFKSLGSFGSATSILNTTVKTQILSANGYYLVQTGTLSYDMVSALDGKAWISWTW